MVEELPIVATQTVKKSIKKGTILARTKKTAAKKKKSSKKTAKRSGKKTAKRSGKKKGKKKKKAAKKPKKKKKKKKKAKKVRFPGGKRRKGQWRSKAHIAGGKVVARIHKSKGIGLYAARSLSADLAAITGKNKLSYGQTVKAVWAYIKKNKLNKGRTVHPDAKLKKVVPANSISMFKMSGHIFKHIK